MKNRLLIVGVPIGMAAMLAACVTKPIAFDAAREIAPERYIYKTPEGVDTGTVRITRDTGLSGSGCMMVISIDGKEAARLDNGERATFIAAVGEHIVSVAPSEHGLCGIQRDRITRRNEIIVRKDQMRTYRAGINPNAGPFFDPVE